MGSVDGSTRAGSGEGAELALCTDLYEITMAASYLALGIEGMATYSLFARKLPPRRSYLIAAGTEEAARRLRAFAFDRPALDYLRSTGVVREDALDALGRLRFTGDVWAVREGRAVFADEPILEVRAPIVEAQIVETLLLNAIHFPTLVASKAGRCVAAARGKPPIDFGLRRTPGVETGVVVARAAWLCGFSATSNLLAGAQLGIPVSGTVAHSFIEILGPKQVYRRRGSDGRYLGDRIAARDEPAPGSEWEPLLQPIIEGGLALPFPSLSDRRALHRAEMEALPPALLGLGETPSYPVERSPVLDERQRAAVAEARRREGLRCAKEAA